MTEFQRNIKEKLKGISISRHATIAHSTYDCEPNDLIGHTVGDVYIKATIRQDDILITIYIYTDEATVQTNRHDFMIELPDYKNDESLLGKVLIDFIENCLDREPPITALENARQQYGLAN